MNAHREEISILKAELAQLVAGKVPPPRPTPALKTEKDREAEEVAPEVEALEKARLLLDGVGDGREHARASGICTHCLRCTNEDYRTAYTVPS